MQSAYKQTDFKKVVSSGKSSLAIVIPAQTVKQLLVRKGDYFQVFLTNENDIILRHNITNQEREQRFKAKDNSGDDFFAT